MNEIKLDERFEARLATFKEMQTEAVKPYFRLISVMIVLFLVAILFPPLEKWVYKVFDIVWMIGFMALFFFDQYGGGDTQISRVKGGQLKHMQIHGRERRMFYVGVWSLSAFFLGYAFSGYSMLTKTSWNILDGIWIIILLRACYTLDRDYREAMHLIEIEFLCYKYPEDKDLW